MANTPNIKRWGLFRVDEPHDAVRRYQLARLEEVALAFPVPGTERPPRRADGQSGGGASPTGPRAQ